MRGVLAQTFFELLPLGDFVNFVATGCFSELSTCVAWIRAAKVKVRNALRPLRRGGLVLPGWGLPAVPDAVAWDPFLLPRSMSRWCNLWQIDCAERSHTLCSSCLPNCLGRINREMDYEAAAFLKRYGTELVIFYGVRTRALPEVVGRLFPRLPREDELLVDYILLFLRFETFELVWCFWRLSIPSLSDDGVSFSSGSESGVWTSSSRISVPDWGSNASNSD